MLAITSRNYLASSIYRHTYIYLCMSMCSRILSVTPAPRRVSCETLQTNAAKIFGKKLTLLVPLASEVAY